MMLASTLVPIMAKVGSTCVKRVGPPCFVVAPDPSLPFLLPTRCCLWVHCHLSLVVSTGLLIAMK